VKVRDIVAELEKPSSWRKGAEGEEAIGRTFERLSAEGFIVLHDRRKPGTRWNLDHVIVGPPGVYVIDAKYYSGRLEIRSTGTIFRPGPKRVYVKDRPQDKRVSGMDWQVGWMRDAVGELIDQYYGAIKPVLRSPAGSQRRSLSPSSGASKLDRRWPPKIYCASQAGEGSSRALDRPDMEHRWGDLVA
jgi:hypothetical protein